MQTLNFPYEVKALDADGAGTFEGHAAIFNNRDHGGDIIAPNAFKEFAETADGSVRLLDQHQLARPIGKCRVTQTAAGLAIKAKLNLAVRAANDAYHLIRDGVLTGLSIGYDVLSGGSEQKSDGTRVLTKLKLWECSVVTFGRDQAQVIDYVLAGESACGHGCALDTGFTAVVERQQDAAGFHQPATDVWSSAGRR